MNPFIGPIYAAKGLNLIMRPSLRRYVITPLLVNISLFIAAIWLGLYYFDSYMAQVLPEGYEWLEWLLLPLFAVAMLLITFYCFTLVANLICAPFNSLLSEAVERELKGIAPDSSTSLFQTLKEVPKTLWAELKKIGFFLSRALPLLLLFFIPGLNLIAPFLWLAFSAWLLASEYLDYPMGNRNIAFNEQRKVLKQHRITSMSWGGSVMLLTMIPFVNFIVMPLAVAGATALYLDKIAKDETISEHEG